VDEPENAKLTKKEVEFDADTERAPEDGSAEHQSEQSPDANAQTGALNAADDDDDPSGWKHEVLCAFDRFASAVTRWTGSPLIFALAVLLVLVWGVTGPIFNYSETWQLVINTGTTIVTFLMVFLIQQSQNKDSQAVHLKLDELLKGMENARNDMIDIEDLTEEELKKLARQFKKVVPPK
jgi:low affinity Fe/Cu permease